MNASEEAGGEIRLRAAAGRRRRGDPDPESGPALQSAVDGEGRGAGSGSSTRSGPIGPPGSSSSPARGKASARATTSGEMRAHSADKSWQQKLFGDCSRMMVKMTEYPQPMIARVHGIATAAGCQVVSMCDLAVALDEARFALPGVNVGIMLHASSRRRAEHRPQARAGDAAHGRAVRRALRLSAGAS